MPREVPQTPNDRNHLLVKVIKSVVQDHLKHQHDGHRPDYSFDDWEYIFGLMGTLDSLIIEEDTSTSNLSIPIPEIEETLESLETRIEW